MATLRANYSRRAVMRSDAGADPSSAHSSRSPSSRRRGAGDTRPTKPVRNISFYSAGMLFANAEVC